MPEYSDTVSPEGDSGASATSDEIHPFPQADPHVTDEGFPWSSADADLKDLVAHLTNNDIHPVLIFGTSASGKSTMLQSLIFNAKQTGIQITIGESVFPPGYPLSDKRQRDAAELITA
jgi:hypothetical protein